MTTNAPSASANTAEPSSSARPWVFYYLLHLLILTLPIAALTWTMLCWVSYFKLIFMDFRVTLPAMTEGLLAFADGFSSPLGLVSAAILYLLVPFGLAWINTRPGTRSGRVFAALFITQILLFLSLSTYFLIETALFLPLLKLVQSVSGGEGAP